VKLIEGEGLSPCAHGLLEPGQYATLDIIEATALEQ